MTESKIRSLTGAALVPAVFMLAVVVVMSAGARPSSEPVHEASHTAEPVLLEGTFRLVGSEPFARIVLTTEAGRDYYVEADDARERFSAYIGQKRKVRGVTGERDLTLAGTERTVREYYIREVEIED